MARYPITCISAFCGRTECAGCKWLPLLNQYYLEVDQPELVSCKRCGVHGACTQTQLCVECEEKLTLHRLFLEGCK